MDDLISDLMDTVNKHATSTTAWLQGDDASSQMTWGVEVPYLAFAWLIGGCNVIPGQRYLGVSGQEKSFKSTFMVELGNWFIQQNGVHLHLDTENKTNIGGDQNTMVEAMSWFNGCSEKRRRLYKIVSSVGEWQTVATKTIEHAREKYRDAAPHERVPVFISVDSLMGRSTAGADQELRKGEGFAPERGYPIASLQITNYLETLNLLGTTVTLGWVQHMKKSMEQTGYGVQYKEKGASASQFACSTHLRISKAETPIQMAGHPSALRPDLPVTGHTLYIKTARSSVGPSNNVLPVNLLWQYVPDEETGGERQAMWYDWHGALGELLSNMKYNKNFKPKMFEHDRNRLNDAIEFVDSSKRIKCKELGLEKASYYEFGKAIDDNIEVRDRVAKFLRVSHFPSVQEAEIDWCAGDIKAKKK